MEGTYPILHGDQPIGQAQITRRGLYYHFVCRLHLSGSVIFRLEISWDDKTENLGIPVPEGDAFVLQKSIPVNRCGSGKPTLRIQPKHNSVKGKFIPLRPDEPFAYLTRLQEARFQIRDGQPGIVLPE